MTARHLLAIFDSVYLLALTGLVGSILFFSFVVAPAIFTVLGAEAGGKFVRALFPRYYAWGVVCCGIAMPALVCGSLGFPELRGPMIGVQSGLLGLGLAVQFYCGNTLTPAINAARDGGPATAPRFDRLHRRSVVLNGVVLLLGVALLIAFASRKGLRTDGIEERSPGSGAIGASPQPVRP